MQRKPKILILYAMFGDGHFQVASALKEQFRSEGRCDAVAVDIFAEAHPALNALFRGLYRLSAAYFPRLYGWSYSWTRGMSPNGLFAVWLHSFGAGRLRTVLRREKPDAVVHTFPFLALFRLRRRSGMELPGFTVVTDYELHNRWLHPDTDGYFVATEELRRELASRGIRPDRVSVTGIPLRPDFQAAAAAAHGQQPDASPAGRVLVMAGGNGMLSEAKQVIDALLSTGRGLELVVVTGRSRRNFEALRRKYAGRPGVTVLGFAEEIWRLMASAACLVTKAGGVTLAEAEALGLPAVVYRPLPGQERGNAAYLAKSGDLKIANTPAELAEAVVAQLGQPRTVRTAAALPAAQAVASAVLQRIGEPRSDDARMPARLGRQLAHDCSRP